MALLIITQANSLEHDILKWPPKEQKPLSGMHLEMNKWLKDDNINILIAKWVVVNKIMRVATTINTLHNRNYGFIKEDNLEIHPFQFWEL